MTDDPIQALVSGVLDRVRDQLQQELDRAGGRRSAPTPPRRAQTAAQAARAEAESAAAALASGAIAAERSAFEETAHRCPRRGARPGAGRGTCRRARRPTWRAPTACWRRCARSTTRPRSATRSTRWPAAAQLEAGRAVVLLVRGDQLARLGAGRLRRPCPGCARADPCRWPTRACWPPRSRPARRRRLDGRRLPTRRPRRLTLDSRRSTRHRRAGHRRRPRRRRGVCRRWRRRDARSAERVAGTCRAAGAPCLAVPRSADGAAVRARADRRGGRAAATADKTTSRRGGTRGCWSPRSSSITRRWWTRGVATAICGRGSDAQITRARQLYEERVPPRVRTQSRLLRGGTGRTLADGDAALLGQAS